MTDSLLDLTGLTKAYPGVVANDDVSLRIAPGEVLYQRALPASLRLTRLRVPTLK